LFGGKQLDGWSEPIGIFFWFFIYNGLPLASNPTPDTSKCPTRPNQKIEQKERGRVVSMIHRQERISLFGIPLYRYIDIEDSEQVLRAIRTTPPDVPICFIIHTPGGLVLAAAQIAMALKDHPAKKKVIIPHYAMSGGTLIALAADEIVMDPHAVLGPSTRR
jgi:ClpP class serine protease